MRFANLLPTLLLPFFVLAQSTPTRFIEVQVTDSVRLPFQGMDLEVRMDDPTQLAMAKASELGDQDIDYAKLLKQAEADAKRSEAEFIALMKTGGYTYRLSSTEHAQDYTGQTDKTFDVNNYLVELKAADMERYYKATEGHSGWSGTPKQAHYGEAATSSPRLMKKLFGTARLKAEALVGVTGGKLGKVISAQEIPRSEGSVLEQLFKMDKSGNKEEMMMQFGSSETVTMSFRFELLD